MHNPLQNKPLLQFAIIFTIVYTCMMLSVIWLEKPYMEAFIRFGNNIAKKYFNEIENPQILLLFQQTPEKQELEMEILIQNLKYETSEGAPTMFVQLDMYRTGLRFVIILISLILASPVKWYRRLLSLAGGFILIHMFICLKIFLSMINSDNPQTAMLEMSEFWQGVVKALDRIFMIETGFGASLAVCIVIWLLITFKKSDFNKLLNLIVIANNKLKN